MKYIRSTPNLLVYFLLGLFWVQGCASSNNMQSQSTPEQHASVNNMPVSDPVFQPESIIQPGDQVELLVWEHSDFNTTTTVSPQGKIAIPLVGEITAGGLTKEELEEEIRIRLSQFIKGDINFIVSISSTNDQTVTVMGSVSRPENYPLVKELTLFEVLSMAGGPTEEADLRNIRIYRSQRSPSYQEIDLDYHLRNRNMSQMPAVGPGDFVYVPREENFVREFSEFLRDVIVVFGLFSVFR